MLLRRYEAMRFAPLSALVVLAAAVTPAPPARASATAVSEDSATDTVLLKVKLTRGGKTLAHPGYMATIGEETVLAFPPAGDTPQEISVILRKAKGGFAGTVAYRLGNKTVVEGKVVAKGKKWATVKKGSVSVGILVDPESTRPDELDLPDGDAPLDGV
jgi:hypothetical protein